MATLGERLREARMAMNETTSQAADATRIKIQIVEDLEMNDFSRISAPIYGKGFIRIYAEHLGLDPRPLIAEYMSRTEPAKRPSIVPEEKAAGAGGSPFERLSAAIGRFRARVGSRRADRAARQQPVSSPLNDAARGEGRLPEAESLRYALSTVAVILVLAFVVVAVTRCVGGRRSGAGREAGPDRIIGLTHEPPDPYID